MTVASETSRAEYTGNGTTTEFPVPFYFLDDGDLVVLRVARSTGATETLTLDSEYTVSGAGSEAGGMVTISPAPSSSYYIVIYRDPDVTQGLDLTPGGALPAHAVETAHDRQVMIDQRTRALAERALRVSDSEVGFTPGDAELPAKGDRANKFFAFDEDGAITMRDLFALVSEEDGSLVLASNVTFRVPTDYPTLQAAVDAASDYRTSRGATITIMVEDGHRVSTGVTVSKGDFRHIRLVSEAGAIECADDFEGDFLTAYKSVAPTLASDLDMRGNGRHAIVLGFGGPDDGSPAESGGADGEVAAGVTISNVPGSAYTLFQGSRLSANETTLDGCGHRAVHATHASILSFRLGRILNTTGDALYASHSSTVNARDVTIDGVTGHAIYARQGSIITAASGSVVDNIAGTDGTSVAVWARGGSHISFTGTIKGGYHGIRAEDASSIAFVGTITDCTDQGALAVDSSRIDIEPGSSISGTQVRSNIRCTGGSTVCARGVELSGANGNDLSIGYGGVIAIDGDTVWTTSSHPVNELSGFGVILDQSAEVEGDWSPTLTSTTPGDLSVSYATQTGRWRKQGRALLVSCDLVCTPTFSTASGGIRIEGLPFGSQHTEAIAFAPVAMMGTFTFRASGTQAMALSLGESGVSIQVQGDGIPRTQQLISNLTSGNEVGIQFQGTILLAE